MKALSLFGVLALGKCLTLIGRDLPVPWWLAPVYLWQDAWLALLFAAFEYGTRHKPWISWWAYGALVLYAAANVPLTRILSSPLTLPMARAARTTLADSIAHYLTGNNLACILLVLTTAAVLPWAFKLTSRRVHLAAIGLVGILSALGPFAGRWAETDGLERNALFAFIRSTLPQVRANLVERDWRASPFPRPPGLNLSHFRGAAAGRNVVLILLESTGASYLRPYGAADDPMPTLSRLAEQAILFEHAYAVYPESIKGLFSVLCSRYPAFDIPARDYQQVRTPAIARRLTEAGYRTGLFHSGRFGYLDMDAIISDRGYECLEDAGIIGGQIHSSFGVDEPTAVKRILAWIDSGPRPKPFFITYLPIAGHHPYDSPEPRPFTGSDEQTHYRNALHYGDAALAQLIDGLKARGLDANTLFVIFGDHGEAFGQHEGNYGHTLALFEENLRVPYLIAAPGLFTGPVRAPGLASLIDTAPTILDLLGLPIPAGYQGTSLLAAENEMALFYTDYSLGFVGLRDGTWKFIYQLDSGPSRLFDLSRDPGEKQNLARFFPEKVAAYRRHLQQWSAAQKGRLRLAAD